LHTARCADCGRLLQAGEKVRGYLQENGKWKIYCFKGHGNGKDEPPPNHSSPSPRQRAGKQQAVSLKEVLERLKNVEAKVDKILALLEGKGGEGQ